MEGFFSTSSEQQPGRPQPQKSNCKRDGESDSYGFNDNGNGKDSDKFNLLLISAKNRKTSVASIGRCFAFLFQLLVCDELHNLMMLLCTSYINIGRYISLYLSYTSYTSYYIVLSYVHTYTGIYYKEYVNVNVYVTQLKFALFLR